VCGGGALRGREREIRDGGMGKSFWFGVGVEDWSTSFSRFVKLLSFQEGEDQDIRIFQVAVHSLIVCLARLAWRIRLISCWLVCDNPWEYPIGFGLAWAGTAGNRREICWSSRDVYEIVDSLRTSAEDPDSQGRKGREEEEKEEKEKEENG